MRRSILKKVQVLPLVFSLVLFTVPGSASATGYSSVPDSVYVRNGVDCFKVELGDMLQNVDDILYTRSGAASISLSRAIWPENTSSHATAGILLPGDIPSVDDLVILEGENSSGSMSAALPSSEIEGWHQLVQLTIAATTDYLEYSWEIGSDTQSLRYPWALLGLSEQDPETVLPDVVVILNGHVADIPFDLLASISSEILESGIIPSNLDISSVEDLGGHFNDHVGFIGNYAGFNLILATILERFDRADPAGCGLSCIGCGIALLGYGISLVALFASCASLTPICILGILGHEVAGASLVLSCSSCFRCLKRDSLASGVYAAPTP